MRESSDPVEREGLRRARIEVGRADRVLWVADVREPLEVSLAAARATVGAGMPFTLVRNKVDLAGDLGGNAGAQADDIEALRVSALTGEGIDALIMHLHAVAGFTGEAPGTFSTRRRHLDALERARGRLEAARTEIGGALELAAEELRQAQTALGELTGELTSDDLLGEIFATFCIGK